MLWTMQRMTNATPGGPSSRNKRAVIDLPEESSQSDDEQEEGEHRYPDRMKKRKRSDTMKAFHVSIPHKILRDLLNCLELCIFNSDTSVKLVPHGWVNALMANPPSHFHLSKSS